LNGYVPPVAAPEPAKRGGIPRLVWLLVALLVARLAYMFLKPAPEPQIVEVEKVVEREVIVRDTVYMQQIEEIETAFNAAQFEQGKAELNDDAKLALHDLAKVLRQNPELKLTIEGHTSAEGDSAVNLKLSEARAQAAVEFLTGKEGIEASRLTAVGKGASEPIDPANPEANRRTEFEISK
ncbi:MAG: OmpA family protein, partial [Duncaniella sp.]|nr:OmpA family protein [Duncaniella sp.]